jgi:hypothetical protein
MVANLRTAHARGAVCWAIAGYLALQIGLTFVTDFWRPEWRHPEYGRKLALVQAGLRAHHAPPDVLALGTSRTAFGIRPADGARGWEFNFGLTGIGPLQELACLRRLLDEGVRPARLLIEIHPPLMHQTAEWNELRGIDLARLGWSDLRALIGYSHEPADLCWRWLVSRAGASYTHRAELVRRCLPDWLGDDRRHEADRLDQITASGWQPLAARPHNAQERRRMNAWSAGLYAGAWREFTVSEFPRRAIDEMLDLCRQQGIDVALVLLPEGDEFRSHYSAAAWARLGDYLAETSRARGVPVFDCGDWCSEDLVCDGQHLLPEGAAAFSARLESDLLAAWGSQSWAAKLARGPSKSRR